MNPGMNRKVALAIIRARQKARKVLDEFYRKQEIAGQEPGQQTGSEQAQPEPPRLP